MNDALSAGRVDFGADSLLTGGGIAGLEELSLESSPVDSTATASARPPPHPTRG